MDGVAHEEQRADDGVRVPMAVRVLVVRPVQVIVPPDQELLEQEEQEDASQRRREHGVGGGVRDGLREQAEERRSEQRSGRVCDECREDGRAHLARQDQEHTRQPECAHASREREAEGQANAHRASSARTIGD
ncbi:MAG TPA: hypothetical protein VFS18_02170, partial [Actinomycetota bacterium]|nr:hypothetical protein [Actinomycetota bacterium]